MGIDAFVLGAQSVECLAVLALHALAPIRDANTVIFLRRIRVGAMLGLPRRAPHLYIFRMGPLDVVVFGEATIDQIVGGFVAFSMRGLDPGLCQAAIRAAGIDVDRNDQLVFRRRYDLHVVSGAPSTIGHFHHPRVGIGGRSARLLLLGHLLLVGLLSPFPLGLQLLHTPLRRCDPRRALAGATLLCRALATIACRRIRLDFSAQALHPRLRCCMQIIKPPPPDERTRPRPPASPRLNADQQAAPAGGRSSPRHPRAPASHPGPTCRPTPNQPEPSTRRPAPEAVPEPPYGRSGSSTGCDSSSTPRRITSDRPDDRGTAGPVGGRCRPHRPWPIAKAPTSALAMPADARAGPRAP